MSDVDKVTANQSYDESDKSESEIANMIRDRAEWNVFYCDSGSAVPQCTTSFE